MNESVSATIASKITDLSICGKLTKKRVKGLETMRTPESKDSLEIVTGIEKCRGVRSKIRKWFYHPL